MSAATTIIRSFTRHGLSTERSSPCFRTHGSRKYNEVWSYGKEAEPILEKYLTLRYQLMPYIYSLGYHTYETGAPIMRALFLDFPDDLPKIPVYAGADAEFALYQDDGPMYDYERGNHSITNLRWDERAKTLTHSGAPAWTMPDRDLIQVIGH